MVNRFRGGRNGHPSINTWKDVLLIMLALAILGGAIWGIVYVISYEKQVNVVIEDRWWIYDQRVRYSEYECDLRLDDTGKLTQECGTEYYTRCSGSQIGREWPPRPPQLSCIPDWGDWVEDVINYRAAYRVDDSNETGWTWISEREWNSFPVGGRGRLTLGAFHTLKSFERTR